MTDTNGRQPQQMPQDLDAERAVLGGLLLDPTLFDDVLPILTTPEMFTGTGHRVIYEALLELRTAGQTDVDPNVLISHLKAGNKMDEAGGFMAIAGLEQYCLSTGGTPFLATKLAELYARRKARSRLMELAVDVQSSEWPDVVAAAATMAQEFASLDTSTRDPWGPPDTIKEVFAPRPLTTYATGNLFARGSVTFLAAAAGTGKTNLCIDLICSCVLGEDFLPPLIRDDGEGMRTTFMPGAFLGWDSGKTTIKNRFRARLLASGIDDHSAPDLPFYAWNHTIPKLDVSRPSHLSALKDRLHKHSIGLLVIDNWGSITPADAEREKGATGALVYTLRPIVEELNLSLILIHHFNKSGVFRDSQVAVDAADDVLELKPEKDGSAITLCSSKRRDNPPFEARLTFAHDFEPDGHTIKTFRFRRLPDAREEAASTLQFDLLSFIRSSPGVTQNRLLNDLARGLGRSVSRREILTALGEVVRSGKAYTTDGARGAITYHLNGQGSETNGAH